MEVDSTFTDAGEQDEHYLAIIRDIERIIPPLSKGSCKLSDVPDLYVLSLISLNKSSEKERKKLKFVDLKNLRSDIEQCIEWGVIIHCVGIWDVAIIVKIKKDGNQIDHIEKYKKRFLYNNYVKRSASTILVGLTEDEVKIICEIRRIKKLAKLIKDKVEEIDKKLVELVERDGITEELVELTKDKVGKADKVYSTKELSEFMVKKFVELIRGKAEKIDDRIIDCKMEEDIIKKLVELIENEINKINSEYREFIDIFKNMFKPTFEELWGG